MLVSQNKPLTTAGCNNVKTANKKARRCDNMPKVRWVVPYGFCSKFRILFSYAKNFENRLNVQSLKVEHFWGHAEKLLLK